MIVAASHRGQHRSSGSPEERLPNVSSTGLGSEPLPATPDLRTLFEQHYPSVWRLLRRLGVAPALLDDATQEVFWVTARRLESITVGSEQAFLYGVALRVARNERRRSVRTLALCSVDEIPALVDGGPSPHERLELCRARELLDEALEQMTPKLRVAFVLFELEGLELRQIAELEGLPRGTVSSRLRRAREEFALITKRLRARLFAVKGRR